MVEAWFFEETAEDQREPHRFTPNRPVALDQLAKVCIMYSYCSMMDGWMNGWVDGWMGMGG
jgi:hypothetical protein